MRGIKSEMNRRSFFGKLAGAVAAFTILPSATTYERIWKPKLIEPVWVVNPEWVTATYELSFAYLCEIQKEMDSIIIIPSELFSDGSDRADFKQMIQGRFT
jgi:hypothetical protein